MALIEQSHYNSKTAMPVWGIKHQEEKAFHVHYNDAYVLFRYVCTHCAQMYVYETCMHPCAHRCVWCFKILCLLYYKLLARSFLESATPEFQF